MGHVSVSPPLIPDSRISRVRLAAAAFPGGPSQTPRGSSARSRTPLGCMVIPPARHRSSFAPGTWLSVQSVFRYGARHLPRAPSPTAGITCRRVVSSTTSESVTPPSSLIWAHAQDRTPLIDYGLGLDRWVFAGCCEPLLADGPSRRYLHSPCMGAWTHAPPRSPVARARYFPGDIGLTRDPRRSARELIPAMRLRQGGYFRGCSHSLMFRLPCSLGPPIAPTAVVTHGAAGPFTPRNGPGVTPRNCGIATCLNRATDTAGLPPAGLWPCRPLHGPLPRRDLPGAFARFFPGGIGLTSVMTRSARDSIPAMQLPQGESIEAAVIPLCSGSHAC